tara:strand:- start:343 stop:1500 length:1158 start_codon:yes stop_codon:yes gene_type:complete
LKFFNSEEEVLDFQLTLYGKQLLSRGKLKPAYYAFFDDDIVYDPQYMNSFHTQNEIQGRILDETPRMRAQAVYDGVETNIKKLIKDIRETKNLTDLQKFQIQGEKEKHYALSLPLGNSKHGYEFDTALKVEFLYGALSGSVNHISGAYSYNIPIPQLVTTASVITQVDYSEEMQNWHYNLNLGESFAGYEGTSVDWGVTGLNSLGLVPTEVVFHDDGTFIRVNAGGILISVEEDGTPFKKDNFEIEIYEVEEEVIPQSSEAANYDATKSEIKKEKLIPLYFEKPTPLIVNNILLDEEDIYKQYDPMTPQKARLLSEYFFDVYTDEEIDDTVICKYIMSRGKHKTKDIFNDRPIECPENTNELYKEVMYNKTGELLSPDEDPSGDC